MPTWFFAILTHWDLCSNRNKFAERENRPVILTHWDLCSNRNYRSAVHGGDFILTHWDLCSNRNCLQLFCIPTEDSNALGFVL